jgi:hypothetical protein
VESFNAYVSRDIEISAEDAAKITTAIVVEDGRHVPTYVYERDGKYYAKINSTTNSTYVLIQNAQSFTDDDGTWYEAAAAEMASRKIVAGVGDGGFAGARVITRAEFAALVTRGLGLPALPGKSVFADIPTDAWYEGAVNTAYKYGLVSGRGDLTFDPDAPITRQEALWLTERACRLAGLDDFSGLMNDGRLRDDVTRAEAVTLILRMLQRSGLVDKRSEV